MAGAFMTPNRPTLQIPAGGWFPIPEVLCREVRSLPRSRYCVPVDFLYDAKYHNVSCHVKKASCFMAVLVMICREGLRQGSDDSAVLILKSLMPRELQG